MRFKFPNKDLCTYVKSLCKSLYKKDFFGFIKELKQRIFKITSQTTNVVVIVDDDERRIDIFHGLTGFQTCHFMMLGDSRRLASYGYNYFYISELDDEEIQSMSISSYVDKYDFYKTNNKKVCYLSRLNTQAVFVVTDSEALIVANVLEYLLHIQEFFTSGEEKIHSTDELVCEFSFDEEDYSYYSSYTPLEHYDFFPGFIDNSRTNPKFVDELSKIEIKEGSLYLGLGIGCSPYNDYETSNNVNIPLLPIILYGITEEDGLEYIIYSTLSSSQNETLKTNLLELFNKIGLYDTVYTDNFLIYKLLSKNLKKLGIEFVFDSSNPYSAIIGAGISKGIFVETDINNFIFFVESLKPKYLEVLNHFINDEDFDDIDFEDDDEFDDDDDDGEEDFDLDSNDVN